MQILTHLLPINVTLSFLFDCSRRTNFAFKVLIIYELHIDPVKNNFLFIYSFAQNEPNFEPLHWAWAIQSVKSSSFIHFLPFFTKVNFLFFFSPTRRIHANAKNNNHKYCAVFKK